MADTEPPAHAGVLVDLKSIPTTVACAIGALAAVVGTSVVDDFRDAERGKLEVITPQYAGAHDDERAAVLFRELGARYAQSYTSSWGVNAVSIASGKDGRPVWVSVQRLPEPVVTVFPIDATRA